MSHFEAKTHRILFRMYMYVRLCLDTVDESQQRRHGVTAAIAVDVVGVLRPCMSLCPSVSQIEFDTYWTIRRQTDSQSVIWRTSPLAESEFKKKYSNTS